MKPETEALARRIAGEPLLDHFLLVGGTALSIYLEHRLSEDLDFATTSQTLPKGDIDDLLHRLQVSGCEIEDNLPLAARHDAINAGFDIEDYQQDWLVDGIKLTFFAIEDDSGREKLAEDPGIEWDRHLRLASLETLFTTKALVLANRHAIRDNFDIYTLFSRGHYNLDDLLAAYRRYRPNTDTSIPINRLLSTDYPHTDPGLAGLITASESEIVAMIHRYFELHIDSRVTTPDKKPANGPMP